MTIEINLILFIILCILASLMVITLLGIIFISIYSESMNRRAIKKALEDFCPYEVEVDEKGKVI